MLQLTGRRFVGVMLGDLSAETSSYVWVWH